MMGTSGNNNTTQASGQNILHKRHEQLERWKASDASKASSDFRKSARVRFDPAVAFLGACSAHDFPEIERLLKEDHVDINTTNIDGLTALHQACIDNNLDLIKFLLKNKADVNAKDNEGWTPLHATASCGYNEVATFLLDNGADVSVVNNDGDLAIDLATDYLEIKALIKQHMRSIDENKVRNAEALKMQKDIRLWTREGRYQDIKDPKTGATPVHVAAAKNYAPVLEKLLKCPGVNINARDFDGWTPLHAAAHWGMEKTCKMLVQHGADMEATTDANQTVFDIADPDVAAVLRELQVQMREAKDKSQTPIIEDLRNDEVSRNVTQRSPNVEQRSSVTRLPQTERTNLTSKIAESEKHPCLESRTSYSEQPEPPSLMTLANLEPPLSDDDSRKSSQKTSNSSSETIEGSPPKPVLPPPKDKDTRLSPPKQPDATKVIDLEPQKPVESKPKEKVVIIEKKLPEPQPPAPEVKEAEPVTPKPVGTQSQVRSMLRKYESHQATPHVHRTQSYSVKERSHPASYLTRSSRIASMPSVSKGDVEPVEIPKPEEKPSIPLIRTPSTEPDLRASQELPPADESKAEPEITQIESSYKPSLSNGTHTRRVSAIMEPTKTVESETQRKSVSRTVRRTKRATQGVGADDVAEARKLMEERQATRDRTDLSAPAEPPQTVSSSLPICLQTTATTARQNRPPKPAPDADRSSRWNSSRPTENCDSGRPVSSLNSSSDFGLNRSRPGSYHGSTFGSRTSYVDASSSDSAPDYKALYEKERSQNEKLRSENDRLKEENETLKRRSSEQRQVDKRLSEYEAQNKSLEQVVRENEKLKAENRALARVVARLSRQ